MSNEYKVSYTGKGLMKLGRALYLGVSIMCFATAVLAHHPYLIMHIDGIAAQTMWQEMAAGNLPNISSVFTGQVQREALSLFIGGTEVIYPRMKHGAGSADPFPVGWDVYDRARQKTIRQPQVLLGLLKDLPAISRSQWLMGVPGGEVLAGLSLLNAGRLLQEYDVLEFFWFATDGGGHFFGRPYQRVSLQTFDWFFGLALRHLDLDQVNLVLYADHGMSSATQWVNLHDPIRDIIGDQLLFYGFPHIYLKDPSQKVELAQALGQRPEVDLAFVRLHETLVRGWHAHGTVDFHETPEGVSYTFEGTDPFDYPTALINQPLVNQEWLQLTVHDVYPAVPPNIYHFMANDLTGDIVVVVNPPARPKDLVSFRGSHAGLDATDLLTPVLMRGPDIQPSDEPFWLNTLYTEVLQIDPWAAGGPNREPWSILARYTPGSQPHLGLVISPHLGWRARVERGDLGWQASLECNAYTSWLSRVWIGMSLDQLAHLHPSVRWQLNLARLSLEYHQLGLWERVRSELRVGYDLTPNLSLQWTLPRQIGLQLNW